MPFGRSWVSLRGLASITLLCVALLMAAGPRAALAQGGMRALEQEEHYVFSESLQFDLQIESPSPIADVVLFYGLAGEPLVRRIYPGVVAGSRTTFTHSEPLERGQFAPGSELRVWWEVSAADGSRLVTDERVLLYEHDAHAWQRLPGGQIELLWYGGDADRQRAEELLAKAQQVIGRLGGQFGVTLTRPIDVYVYNTQRDMLPALSARSDVYDEQILTLGVAIDDDTLLLLGSHRDAEITIAHELSHIVVGIATDNPFVEVPRWLDEGLAMHAEPELPRDNREALERGIRDDALLSVRSMTSYSGRAEEVDLYYGEVYSLTEFILQEYGREKVQALLAAIRGGQSPEEALQMALGLDLADLDARWRQSLGLEPRTMAPVVEPQGVRPPASGAAPPTPPPDAPQKRDRVCPLAVGMLILPLTVVGWRSRSDWLGH